MKGATYIIRDEIIANIKNGVPLKDIFNNSGSADKRGFYKTVLSLINAGEIANTMVCSCGFDCSRCRTFYATVNDDDEAREMIRGLYAEMGHTVEKGELNCFGCRSDEMMPLCSGCPYLKCGRERGLERCGECNEYPCESLKWYKETYLETGMNKFYV